MKKVDNETYSDHHRGIGISSSSALHLVGIAGGDEGVLVLGQFIFRENYYDASQEYVVYIIVVELNPENESDFC